MLAQIFIKTDSQSVYVSLSYTLWQIWITHFKFSSISDSFDWIKISFSWTNSPYSNADSSRSICSKIDPRRTADRSRLSISASWDGLSSRLMCLAPVHSQLQFGSVL